MNSPLQDLDLWLHVLILQFNHLDNEWIGGMIAQNPVPTYFQAFHFQGP